jgi:glucosamine--fructose-6-phosphate aminotransferase (isomerizing)
MNSAPQRSLMETETREIPLVASRLAANADALVSLCGRLSELSPLYALAAGRGSSDAAALFAKYIFEIRLGLPTVSAAPSITSVYGRRLKLENALVLAISQSGRSPDLVEFCRAAAGRRVLRVGLLNDLSSPLADSVDVAVPLQAGSEKSVAATKSCLAAMLLVFGLAAHWLGDDDMLAAFERAADSLADALDRLWPEAERFLEADGPVYVVGRGPGLAVAAEAALKLKETNGLHAEAVSAAELRHGPLALAGGNLRVLMFAPKDAAFASLASLRDELEQRDCPVLFICSDPANSPITVAPDREPVLELLSMLTRFYLLANASALHRGLSPDRPRFLTKITETR